MATVTIEIDIKQIEAAIKSLKTQEKIKLIEDLERQAWPDRFRDLLTRIDSKAAKHPISEQEINHTCEEVRHKRNAHRRH